MVRTDMAGQVRAYAEHLETQINDWEIDDLLRQAALTRSNPPVRVQSRRGPLIGLAAMTLVLAFGAILWLVREAPSNVVGVTPSTVTPTPSTAVPALETTVLTTTLVPDEVRLETVSGEFFEWTRIRLPGDELGPVAVFDGGLAVAGGNRVWMSPDGVTWTKTNPFPANVHIRDILAGGPGLIAVTAGGAAGTGPPGVWTSTDGIAWTRAELDGYYAGGGSYGSTLRAVAGGGRNYVAVGHNFIATSHDGVRWTGSSVTGLGSVWMHDVAVGGPGFVAVGGSEDGWSAAWTSQDGTTWSRQSFGPKSGSWTQIIMSAVTTGGPGFVAVGQGPLPGDDDPLPGDDRVAWVWTSPDGFTWTRAPHDAAAFENAGMGDVVAYGDTLVAVGGTEQDTAVVWTSTDGITWQRLPHNDLFNRWGMSSVVAYRGGLVAVGGDSVWIATPQPSDESTP